MAVAPTVRLQVQLEDWNHGYRSEYDEARGGLITTRHINATGLSTNGLSCTVIGCRYPPSPFSPIHITVSFKSGTALPFEAEVAHLAPCLIHTETRIKSHSGWVSFWSNNDEERSELTAEVYLPTDAFEDIYGRLKTGVMLLPEIWIDAAGATLRNEPGMVGWDVSGPKFLFIVGFSLYFPRIKTPHRLA